MAHIVPIWKLLFQFCSTKAHHNELFVTAAKDPSQVNNDASQPINSGFFFCVPNIIVNFLHRLCSKIPQSLFLLLFSAVFGTGLEISGSAPAVKRGWRGRNGVARKRVVEVVMVGEWVGGGA